MIPCFTGLMFASKYAAFLLFVPGKGSMSRAFLEDEESGVEIWRDPSSLEPNAHRSVSFNLSKKLRPARFVLPPCIMHQVVSNYNKGVYHETVSLSGLKNSVQDIMLPYVEPIS